MTALDLMREVEPLLARIEAVGITRDITINAPTRSVGVHFADSFDAKRVARMLGGLSSSHYDSANDDGFTTYEGAVWLVDDDSSDPINVCLYGPRDSERARQLAGTAVQA